MNRYERARLNRVKGLCLWLNLDKGLTKKIFNVYKLLESRGLLIDKNPRTVAVGIFAVLSNGGAYKLSRKFSINAGIVNYSKKIIKNILTKNKLDEVIS